MKAIQLPFITMAVASCAAAVCFAEDQPAVEELPATASQACCGPIVTYRKVYLNETLPQLGSRLYDNVDYELKIRALTRDINVAEAELAVERDRERVYDRYFSKSTALYLTRQETKLSIVRLEEQLKLLRQQKLLALRHRNDQIRYRELLLEAGTARLFLTK